MQCLGALESVRVAPSASSSLSGGAVGKHVNSTTSLHLHKSSRPLPSSLVFNLPNPSFFRPNTPSSRTSSFRCFSALSPWAEDYAGQSCYFTQSGSLYEGNKGFSTVWVFTHGRANTEVLECAFETINILENELLRQGLKEYSSWPTFPQLYIDGEFFGGCDITVDAYKSGELQEQLEKAMCS